MILNIFIFLAGLLVYGSYSIPGLACLLGTTVLSYLLGLLIPKCRWTMWIGIIISALALVLLKLQPVTGMELLAPMGVSYFTLQIISYLVDVYRGKYPPERNLFRYALFVTYLPHLFIGPIERYDVMGPALFENRRISWDGISEGAVRVAWGFFKKLVIASRAGVLVSAISADPAQYRGGFALLATILYSVQLYADFSGGMDMVLGVSRMLGIRLSENFNTPYFSQSFQEFWRRWHITLGAWLREYVYIPLGGNRKGKVRKFLNLVMTFLVSGLWHGVHYLLWGLFNGIFVACGEKLKTRWKLLNQAVTFLLVSLLWAFFVWPDAWTSMQMIGSVFTTFNYGAVFSGIGELGLNLGEGLVLIAAVGVLWGRDLLQNRLAAAYKTYCPAARVAVICVLVLVVLVFGMYGIGFNAAEFIYSQF